MDDTKIERLHDKVQLEDQTNSRRSSAQHLWTRGPPPQHWHRHDSNQVDAAVDSCSASLGRSSGKITYCVYCGANGIGLSQKKTPQTNREGFDLFRFLADCPVVAGYPLMGPWGNIRALKTCYYIIISGEDQRQINLEWWRPHSIYSSPGPGLEAKHRDKLFSLRVPLFRSPNCRRGNPKSTSPPEKHASIRLDSTGKELCQHIITSKPTEENIPLEHAYSPESFLEVTAWLIEALFSSSSSDQSLRYIPAHPLTCFIYGRCTYNTGKFPVHRPILILPGPEPGPISQGNPRVSFFFLFHFSLFPFWSPKSASVGIESKVHVSLVLGTSALAKILLSTLYHPSNARLFISILHIKL